MPRYQLYIYEAKPTGGTYVRDHWRVPEPAEGYQADSIEAADALVAELRAMGGEATRTTYVLAEISDDPLWYVKSYYPDPIPCDRCNRPTDPDDLRSEYLDGREQEFCPACHADLSAAWAREAEEGIADLTDEDWESVG